MNLEAVERVAEAVLYEGYMLYPYRPSSVKNQQRWNFGVLCPRSYCEQEEGSEAWLMRTECLLRPGPATLLTVKVRFLQIVQRSIGRLKTPGVELPEGVTPEFERVDRLEVAGRSFLPWQEAVEREIVSAPVEPSALSSRPVMHFAFPGGTHFESLRDEDQQTVGVIVRESQPLFGSVEFFAQPAAAAEKGVIKISVLIRNLAPFALREDVGRDEALMFSLVSVHTILGVDCGEFVSLLDPPEGLAALAASCANTGTWPVLAGERGKAQAMLSSPIILYDYPEIAPESAGNLFDGTEIDEILSLRILTLTDEEKREMRQSDDRAKAILERTETMPEEQFMKLHGVLRGIAPAKEEAR
ncbi:MAG TPA: hypothetical protein VGR96_15070 [Acidobacteriaceae bacterium]|nr:hypothetical protein [Acidobacteriaceae bacterium]